MYAAIAYAIGMEWSDPRYSGNSERYAFLFVFLLMAGLILLLYSAGRLKGEKAPTLKRRGKVVYSVLFVAFGLAFAAMWGMPIAEIMRTGTTAGYDAMRTGFWTVRVLDLGVSIPLCLLSVYLLLLFDSGQFHEQGEVVLAQQSIGGFQLSAELPDEACRFLRARRTDRLGGLRRIPTQHEKSYHLRLPLFSSLVLDYTHANKLY